MDKAWLEQKIKECESVRKKNKKTIRLQNGFSKIL